MTNDDLEPMTMTPGEEAFLQHELLLTQVYSVDMSGSLDLRPALDYEEWYVRLDQTYCSTCGKDSQPRNDLFVIKVYNAVTPSGYLYTACPDHRARSKYLTLSWRE